MAKYTEKKEKVLLLHHNKISEITYKDHGKVVTKYQTRANWTKGGKIKRFTEKELIEELYKHYYPNDDTKIPTVSEAFNLWIKEREDFHLADPKTILHNRKEWERYFEGKELSDRDKAEGKMQFVRADFIDMRVTEVKASQIIRHMKYLIGDGNITRKTLTNLKTPLIGAFSYAISQDLTCIDPRAINLSSIARRCKQPKDNDREVYTREMIKKIKDYLEGLEEQTVYTLAIRLCINLGCRIGELRAIHWEDYDRDNRKLYLHRQMVDVKTDKRNRVAMEKDYMKSRSPAGKRELPLTEDAVNTLEALKKINGDKMYILSNQNGDKPIFTNRFNDNLKKVCESVGIPYYSSHKIRFGVVTSMYEAGISEKVIQSWAGHSDITTTRHYDRRSKEIKLTPEDMEKVFG
ncbi:MAG: site-specific integrase [Lachnospiraceae bacterium]|nr:site-specific integrase [Lachnospiraceae bacterium]